MLFLQYTFLKNMYICIELLAASEAESESESSPQHTADRQIISPTAVIGSKAFTDVLKVLEDERIELETQLENAVHVSVNFLVSIILVSVR